MKINIPSDILKKLTPQEKKIAQELIKNFHPGNLFGKNTKIIKYGSSNYIELRGPYGLRIIINTTEMEIITIFSKSNHKNTSEYIKNNK